MFNCDHYSHQDFGILAYSFYLDGYSLSYPKAKTGKPLNRTVLQDDGGASFSFSN
jgi:hypothetical protein